MCTGAQVWVYLTGIYAAAGKQLYLRNSFSGHTKRIGSGRTKNQE